MSSSKKVLCIGFCCIDSIFETPHFPLEDTDQRCLSQRCQRGGNASNSATVLSLLGAPSSFMGTIADTFEKGFLLDDFHKYDVDISNAVIIPGVSCPQSCVISSLDSGSRTIIHSNKDLPELTLEHFKNSNYDKFSWIHFEGRNVPNITQMIKFLAEENEKSSSPITVSIEVEKAKPVLEHIVPLADVLFVGKDYAMFCGCKNMNEALDYFSTLAKPRATIICPWGEMGAAAQDKDGKRVKSDSFPPSEVVDTLGAGDTFLAATIFGLSSKWSLEESISFGCRIAGMKVGVRGWDELKKAVDKPGVKELLNSKNKETSCSNNVS